MKNLILILSVLLLASCGGKTDKEKARNDYRQALTDSISAAERQIDSCENRIAVLNNEISERLADFTDVTNPREVEGYYIFKGWESKYPLSSTGVIARISHNEQLELIAALQGGVFNTLEAQAPDVSATTSTVPHDQALNYRREGLNTVMFSGAQADSVAALIADNELNPVKIVFLDNSKPVKSMEIDNGCKKMIAATWMLYSSRRELGSLERRVMLLREKINLLRAHRDKENAEDSAAQ